MSDFPSRRNSSYKAKELRKQISAELQEEVPAATARLSRQMVSALVAGIQADTKCPQCRKED
jgi:hypothetical protein